MIAISRQIFRPTDMFFLRKCALPSIYKETQSRHTNIVTSGAVLHRPMQGANGQLQAN